MLQQTQAKTVIPYFNRFMKQFPNLESLAGASESKVMEFWAGLGYYNRARNLHKAAKQIVTQHGSFPREFETVLALPGVGRYTAGAICSLSFNQKQPVLDGNVRRVLIRLNGIRKQLADSHHWTQMSVLLPAKRISAFNQAMMELGAVVCVPFQPQCRKCPVSGFCEARKLGIQDNIPKARPSRPLRRMRVAILVLEQSGRILMLKGKKPQFIPGEWGLPCESVTKGRIPERTASLLCSSILGCAVPLFPLAPIRHSITRYRISAYGFYGEIKDSVRGRIKSGGIRWISCGSDPKSLTSSLFRKVLQQYVRLR